MRDEKKGRERWKQRVREREKGGRNREGRVNYDVFPTITTLV